MAESGFYETDEKIINCLIQDRSEEHVIKVLINSQMTLEKFKLKLEDEYKLPYECQFLIIPSNNEINLNEDGNQLILNLIDKHKKDNIGFDICVYILPKIPDLTTPIFQCKKCTFINKPDSTVCEICFCKLDLTADIKCILCLSNFSKDKCFSIAECKHIFCKECLVEYINNLDDVQVVKCPFSIDQGDFSCNNTIKENEIFSLLDQKSFDRYKLKLQRQSDLLVSNRIHCLTPDCANFFEINPNLISNTNNNLYKCNNCSKVNCIKCKNIFENYFKALRHNCNNELDPRQNTTKELEELINSGIIMRCPKCNILLEKRDSGCQFVRCYFCKLDICWLTRQPRWGPNGKGDISGGCKCGVDGKKCHPDCQNCH